MPTRPPECPKCHHAMELGMIIDATQAGYVQSHWLQGAADPQTVFGLKTSAIKTRDKTQLTVTTFRCPKCGYLESYADSPPTD